MQMACSVYDSKTVVSRVGWDALFWPYNMKFPFVNDNLTNQNTVQYIVFTVVCNYLQYPDVGGTDAADSCSLYALLSSLIT